ncbi:MAG: hypothetical protein JKY12_04345 [Sneathiella sp.]|nr:hypothetical protein [Sneathiella sp.]
MARIFIGWKTKLVPVSLLLLSACSGGIDTDLGGIFGDSKPILPCPTVTVLPNADNITIFQDGPGRDLVDVKFEGVLAPVSGECLYEGDNEALQIELILRIGAVKGPAARSQIQDFPFFVAIADKSKKILNKKIFISPIEIPAGRRRAAVQEEMEQRIPLPAGRSGRDYTIVVGFQLTPEQFEFNQKTVK